MTSAHRRNSQRVARRTIAAVLLGFAFAAASCSPQPMTPADLYEKVRPSILLVRSSGLGDGPKVEAESPECASRPLGGGSGFVIDDDGHIVTNAHVVRPCPQSWPEAEFSVELADGTRVKAELVGVDPIADIAVLKVDARLGAPLPFPDQAPVRVGEEVVAIGYPSYLQLGVEPTLSRGVVSVAARSIGYIGEGVQTDASVNHGNSGGPLLNLKGQVVGVNTVVFGRTPEQQVQNINFAISWRVAERVARDIIAEGQAKRASLGDLTYMFMVEEDTLKMKELEKLVVSTGMMLLDVAADSPLAGKVNACDLIQRIDGRHIRAEGDFYNALLWAEAGKEMTVDFLHYPPGKCEAVPDCAGRSSLLSAFGTGCPLDPTLPRPSGLPGGQEIFAFLTGPSGAEQQAKIDAEAERILAAYSADGTPQTITVTPQ